jgi:hypothetical protein
VEWTHGPERHPGRVGAASALCFSAASSASRRGPIPARTRRRKTRPSRERPSRWTEPATRVPPAAGAKSQRRSPQIPRPSMPTRNRRAGRASRLSSVIPTTTGPTRKRACRRAPAAGQSGPAGSRSSRTSRQVGQLGSWSAAHTSSGGASTKRRRSMAPRGSRGWEPAATLIASWMGPHCPCPGLSHRPRGAPGMREAVVTWSARVPSRST